METPRTCAAALALALSLSSYCNSPLVYAAETPVSYMKPVRSFQARIESVAPVWDAEHQVFVSGYVDATRPFRERYEDTLDSVTTASVEGALMYLQRDCIDVGSDPAAQAQCKRKNDVRVITFLEVTIVQPFLALSYYQANRYIYPEFCPFVTMQNGQCVTVDEDILADMETTTTTTRTTSTASSTYIAHPPDCQLYHGLYANQSAWTIGPCVGAHAYPTDMVAPYPDTVWFSYPGSCVMNTWTQGKSAACRETYRGGLCPFGTEPDGVKCTFKYRIIGYLSIDELAGITASATSSAVGDVVVGTTARASSTANASSGTNSSAPPYRSYKDFCEARGVEFHSFDADTSLGLSNVTAIPFWRNPSSRDANVERTKRMIALYNANVAAAADGRMVPLPTNLTALTESNPPCHGNAKICYDARFGCQRHSYAQVCTVCREQGAACVTRDPSVGFPTLAAAPGKNQSAKSTSQSTSRARAPLTAQAVNLVTAVLSTALLAVAWMDK